MLDASQRFLGWGPPGSSDSGSRPPCCGLFSSAPPRARVQDRRAILRAWRSRTRRKSGPCVSSSLISGRLSDRATNRWSATSLGDSVNSSTTGHWGMSDSATIRPSEAIRPAATASKGGSRRLPVVLAALVLASCGTRDQTAHYLEEAVDGHARCVRRQAARRTVQGLSAAAGAWQRQHGGDDQEHPRARSRLEPVTIISVGDEEK